METMPPPSDAAGSLRAVNDPAEPAASPGPRGDAPRVSGYELIDLLGAGGMGCVWRAVQLSTRRPVALKVLGAGSAASARARRRFDREIELTARLEHPHVARLYDRGADRGVYFYAMELVDGQPLDRYAADRRLGRRQVLELMALVCRAVHHAHVRGIIHRDLKPSNILVTPAGEPKVLDFGLAKDAPAADGPDPISVDGDVVGTLPFMSPEQADGRPLDTRSDVYSLGVVLYRLLTGRSPHDLSGSRLDVLGRVSRGQITRPRRSARTVDRELEAVLLKALARDPDARYDAAGGLARDLEAYLRGEPVSARRATLAYLAGRWLRRYRWPVLAGLGLAAAAVLLHVVFGFRLVVSRSKGLVLERGSPDLRPENRFAQEHDPKTLPPEQAAALAQPLVSELELTSALERRLSALADERAVLLWQLEHAVTDRAGKPSEAGAVPNAGSALPPPAALGPTLAYDKTRNFVSATRPAAGEPVGTVVRRLIEVERAIDGVEQRLRDVTPPQPEPPGLAATRPADVGRTVPLSK